MKVEIRKERRKRRGIQRQSKKRNTLRKGEKERKTVVCKVRNNKRKEKRRETKKGTETKKGDKQTEKRGRKRVTCKDTNAMRTFCCQLRFLQTRSWLAAFVRSSWVHFHWYCQRDVCSLATLSNKQPPGWSYRSSRPTVLPVGMSQTQGCREVVTLESRLHGVCPSCAVLMRRPVGGSSFRGGSLSARRTGCFLLPAAGRLAR
jgi:hypothetical protein